MDPVFSAPPDSSLLDSFGRRTSYLRISVTDRCNFRCLYCRGRFDNTVSHSDILRYEEIEVLLGIAVQTGVRKVRFTGGEPFVRKGFMPFLERIREAFPTLALHVTSNGTMPADSAARLKALDVRVNLSLDTLRRDRFTAITGVDALSAVQANITRLLDLGVPFKLNAVAMRGVNDDELPDFLNLAFTLPVEVRFIELMPMGAGAERNSGLFLPARSLEDRARSLYKLLPLQPLQPDFGPARVWRLRDASGRLSTGTFGLISSVTRNACAACNRLRLTSEGNLRTCLFDNREYRLRPALRHPKLGPDAVREIWKRCVARKPVGAWLLDKDHPMRTPVTKRCMVSIGG